MTGLPPLSLYAHFPWCVAKCPYCDFNSHSLRGDLPAVAYTDALIRDLELSAQALQGREISTVFFGGGTPSLFPPEELARFLAAVREHLSLADDAEITLEANPGAVEHAAFEHYLAAGINRLSLGVQSLNDNKLRALGRIHTAADARAAFHEARSAGFANINLDLMYGLPEQTAGEALKDIEGVLELAPEHISHYHLTLEPNTVFYANPPTLPDTDLAWEIHSGCAAALEKSAYDNYEVSAWASPGSECRHNLNYWRFGDYLGLGAGAHGKLTTGDSIIRQARPAHPLEYMRAVEAEQPAGHEHPVEPADVRFEFMLNNLRLRSGFDLSRFEQLTGQSREELAPGLELARKRLMLEFSAADHVRPTPQGWRFLDDLQAIFLPEEAE